MPAPASSALVFRTADLSQSHPTSFDLAPQADALRTLAEALELSALRKVRFAGEIRTEGKHDWRLTATLGATVVQPCVVTLEPVTTRIDVPVERLFLADYAAPDAAEVEMPDDETIEPLPAEIDIAAVMEEALALHLPAYPRKDGAESGATVFTEPGKTPLSDEDMRPFAGLAALRDKLADRDD